MHNWMFAVYLYLTVQINNTSIKKRLKNKINIDASVQSLN